MYECMLAWGDEIDLLVVERLFIIEFPVVSNLPTSLHLVRTVTVVEIKAWASITRYRMLAIITRSTLQTDLEY